MIIIQNYVLDVDMENQPSTSSSMLPDQLPSNYNESAVFYGPDGQIVS